MESVCAIAIALVIQCSRSFRWIKRVVKRKCDVRLFRGGATAGTGTKSPYVGEKNVYGGSLPCKVEHVYGVCLCLLENKIKNLCMGYIHPGNVAY